MTVRFKPLYQLIIANLFMSAVILFRFRYLPPQIPLFYSNPPGENQLADTWMIGILPLFMNSLFFLNRFINFRLFKNEEFIQKIFQYLNLFLIISFTLIFAKIIFLIT
ncbi:hypothetical protein A2774_02310 [Candidatus Roizmanbacteria bacterium RIFCSPHIGHO2_01_FULL_39_12c]|uniref:DUF1648 domain-containing protein n=1 Tax=Candidatus Roizmanbacteria bacterium RIFCSPHIGHO2_01_FULL_39_12c TaxID=1802031 RepID=A0A1F7GE08_9BACT|nr:MAG: hypothetical protein A2774_02310 [Candidatus Roizmanbacteria bacterium RIFCSPHIGHO2_01_FULL_39_12c]OGK47599.1 MAG: hypothetical protein A2963_01035 [Candidatus Roizmanbacteria bacterium RIFCSPLOWO2_01_FULL_40_13]